MNARSLFGLACLLPALAQAWEEERVLAYVMVHNPLIQAHRAVTAAYQPPGALAQVMAHTALFVRLSSGSADTTNEDGSTTRTDPVTAGIQVTIPLASPKEKREYAEKTVAEVTKIDEIGQQTLADMAKLRQHEADMASAAVRQEFYQAKSKWLQDRVNQGYDEAEVLWDNSQQLNAVTAEIKRLELLIDAQRKQLAQRAGAQWQALLAYLAGRDELRESVRPP